MKRQIGRVREDERSRYVVVLEIDKVNLSYAQTLISVSTTNQTDTSAHELNYQA